MNSSPSTERRRLPDPDSNTTLTSSGMLNRPNAPAARTRLALPSSWSDEDVVSVDITDFCLSCRLMARAARRRW